MHLYNLTSIAREEGQECEQICICQKKWPHLVDPATGHVRGKGGAIFGDTRLAKLVDLGLNYRPQWAGGKHLAKHMVRKVWFELAPIVRKGTGCTYNQLKAIRGAFYIGCMAKIQAANKAVLMPNNECMNCITQQEHCLENKDLNQIQQLKEHIAFTKADKAEKALGFECKYAYKAKLVRRVTDAENFALLQADPSVIATEDADAIHAANSWWLDKSDIPIKPAFLASTIKFHKEPIGDRFITPMHNCPLMPVTSLLGEILRWLFENAYKLICTNQEEYIRQEHGVDIRLCWVIKSAQEFVLNMPSKVTDLFGADVERCYERPPLIDDENSLEAALKWFIKTCCCHPLNNDSGKTRKVYFTLKKANPSSQQGKPCFADRICIIGWADKSYGKRSMYVNVDSILAMCRLVLSRIHIQVGAHMYRQLIGFPMGMHVSSIFCDIYFAWYEYHFIWRAIMTGKYMLAAAYRYAYRYQDDLTVLNNPSVHIQLDPTQTQSCANVNWIYPLHLVSVKETTEIVGQQDTPGVWKKLSYLSTMMILTVTNSGEIICTREVYKKADTLPFIVPRYTNFFSCVPEKSLYTILHGQFSAVVFMVNTTDALKIALHKIVAQMVNNGLNPRMIIRQARLWFWRSFIYLPSNIYPRDVVAMIKDGLGTR
jgi:hypothetical protein